jgi:heme-degrading monooxygenase HmoA
MSIKIIIKRKVPKEIEKEVLPLIKELRFLTTKQEGYISGETLDRVDKPGQSLVISTWQSIEDWNNWLGSAERKAIQDRIDELLGEKTEYELYGYAQ